MTATTDSDVHRLAALRLAAAEVADPEIPVLTIADLGILRDVRFAADGLPEVVLTPTYSGCPATEAIRQDVLAQTRAVDPRTRVVIELAPAWTTDWITEDGKAKLRDYGIAPPRPTRTGPVAVRLGRPADHGAPDPADAPLCPRCGTADTELISQFGSTPCKSLRRCRGCGEPFDEFKSL
ncbi:MAG: 1,2-phenylacetyl-CoA epoxidase subunit PaaD [Jatrophihabitantaceae bacterium]